MYGKWIEGPDETNSALIVSIYQQKNPFSVRKKRKIDVSFIEAKGQVKGVNDLYDQWPQSV